MNSRGILGSVSLVAFALVMAACGSGLTTSPTTGPGAAPPPASGGTAADVTININGMAGDQSYAPNPGTVKVGQSVAWHNIDSIAHTATGNGFDTGTIPAGATSAPITLKTAGTFNYQCAFHPMMVGTLNVTQ
jgi:plastocyanin